MMETKISKYIHDINSSISALDQSLELANDNFDSDKILSKKILELANTKVDELLASWEQLKQDIC